MNKQHFLRDQVLKLVAKTHKRRYGPEDHAVFYGGYFDP